MQKKHSIMQSSYIAFKSDLPFHVQPRADVSSINVDQVFIYCHYRVKLNIAINNPSVQEKGLRLTNNQSDKQDQIEQNENVTLIC